MSKAVLTFCSKALPQLQKIAKQSKNNSVLVSVASGGCNGLSYRIEPLQGEVGKTDVVMHEEDVDVVICGRSLLYLINSKVFWLEDNMGSRFDFTNPNAQSRCGCGTTFSITR